MKKPLLSSLLLAATGILRAAEPNVASAAGDPQMVRIGFSQSLFAGVNQNDAYAALKVYAQNISTSSGFTAGHSQMVLAGTDGISAALQLKQVDLLSLTAEEFLSVEPTGVVGPLLVSGTNETCTEEYLLLVRADSPIQRVLDLKGRSLNISSDVRASLANIWLDVLCHDHGVGPPTETFAKITPGAKPSLVVLPVFFRQTDACVVTRSSFDVMAELNPQLKKQLRIVAVSPAVLPVVSCFRRGYSEELKQRVIDAAINSHTQPSFKQMMALFKNDRLYQRPLSELATARALVAAHRRLAANPAEAKAPRDPKGESK